MPVADRLVVHPIDHDRPLGVTGVEIRIGQQVHRHLVRRLHDVLALQPAVARIQLVNRGALLAVFVRLVVMTADRQAPDQTDQTDQQRRSDLHGKHSLAVSFKTIRGPPAGGKPPSRLDRPPASFSFRHVGGVDS
jgi:hypothetical protein